MPQQPPADALTRFSAASLNHGDLLGFSGIGFQARAIQLGTFSWVRRVNHIAIVTVDSTNGRRIWESTTGCDLPCALAGRIVSGVQCHQAADRLRHAFEHRQLVWHYPLRHPPSAERSRRLSNLLYEKAGLPYDYLGALWARSCAFGWLAHRLRNREDLDAVFCSELAALGLRALGAFYTINASMWNPAFLLRTLEFLGIVWPPRLIVEGRLAA